MEHSERIRGGGKETPKGFLFELTGGNPALDLANTVDNRPTDRRRELLRTYEDLVAWGEQSGSLTSVDAARLRRQARTRPSDAERALIEARAIREAVFATFSKIAEGSRPPRDDLATLNAAIPQALAHLCLAPSETGYAWRWDAEESQLDRVVWPAIRSVGELLTSCELTRVRVCAAETCDWLFLDTSRNRSRRWCDMTVCGNRSKVRNFHTRQKRER